MKCYKIILLSIILISTFINSYSLLILFYNNSKKALPNYKLMVAKFEEETSTTILGQYLAPGSTRIHEINIDPDIIYHFGIFTSFEKIQSKNKKKCDKFSAQIKPFDVLKNQYTVIITISQNEFKNVEADLNIFDEYNKELITRPSLQW